MSLADPPVPRCFDEVGTFWFGLGFLMGEGSYRNDSVIYPFSFPPRNQREQRRFCSKGICSHFMGFVNNVPSLR